MKKIYLLLVSILVTSVSFGQDLIISGVFDATLTGGTPKGVELYVVNDIADLSIYGIGSANNGGGTDGEEFTFPADSYTAGDFVYVASESVQFNNWFGFAPNYTTGVMGINGDDAVELFKNGSVTDVFGDINTDGTGEAWEYKDGWAYRVSDTGPDGSTFVLANWTFSGPDALDGETDNATAATPFPVGTFMITPPASGPSVLVLAAASSTSYTPDVKAKLDATGRFSQVDIFQLDTATPNLAFLNNYNAILVFTDAGANNPSAAGDVVAQYLEGGGGVVSATFLGNIQITGDYLSNYSLYYGGNQTQGTTRTLGTINVPTSPVLANVTTFNGGSNSFHNVNGTIRAGAVVDAEYDNGDPLVISQTNVGPANVNHAFLNFYPPSSDARSDFWDVSTDGALLMANALEWVAGITIGESPVISCPENATADTEAGECGAVVNFADASAIDAEDGALPTTQTIGPASGSVFPIGDTIIEFSATDSDGNTSTCQFTITVNDVEYPTAVCQNLTIELNASGMATITPADIDAGSTDNCSVFNLEVSQDTFGCADVGDVTVTLSVYDESGNLSTCDATVTVIDDIAPVVNCIGTPSGLEVFVNEFHYDNTGADVNEFIEIAGPAGTDLTNWAIWKYNGNNSQFYGDGEYLLQDFGPDVIIDDEGDGFGALVFQVGSLQNGSPDGFALVNNNGIVVQFLSYEGSFTAVDGAAAGMVSEDVGVFEPNSTPIGHSLQLSGTGSFYADFTWNDPIPESPGSLNVGQTLEVPVVLPPYEIILDADGTATIPVTTFISSIEEGCGYTVSNGAGSTNATLSSPLVGGNGNFGNMFDIVATNEVVISSFDIHGDTGVTFDVEVYAKVGTHVGSENNPADWTLIDTAYGIASNGDGVTTPLNLNLDYAIPAGETHAFFVSPIGGGFNYHNGTAVGNVVSSDDNIALLEGSAKADDFTGTTFAPRVFEGNIIYSVGPSDPTVFTFDCSDIGETNVEVFVTDDSGNTSSCTTSVIISDQTAPVIVCGPDPLLYSADSVSDSPALAIPDSNPTGVTTTIEITDDFTITDINVPVNITHTWIGDLIVSLTSPTGTEVVLHNRTGGSDDDIVVTYDDEGTAGANPLSAFDGESTLGIWTLFVSDNAGGDTGTINSWGIDYEYSYPNPNSDLIIELGEDGTVSLVPEDVLSYQYDACGFDVLLLDITEFDCDDVGTATLVTVFANDASGNFASCQVEVNIVDAMEPTLTCPDPATYGIEPSNNDGVYVVRDYYGIGAATYSDNCTDMGDLIVTQDPAPGTEWGINGSGNPGPYVVTFTIEDESGNIATCTLEVTVTNGIGVSENTLLNNALSMYPNPTTDMVTLVNTSDIALESAMIYDINGKLVADINLDNMGTETTFDVSGFANGVYMVKIIGENASTVKRLIKE